MYRFIQRHQKYFYIVITVVIVISFSFFGTYGALVGTGSRDKVAFTAIDGSKITRGELEEMAFFIQTDKEDKKLFGGRFGPNFMNDGVISKDILNSGIGELLIQNFPEEFESDLEARSLREKSFKPYAHPQASFVSADVAWSYFAPQIKENLEIVKKGEDPLNSKNLRAKINLYLAQKVFSAPFLSRVLLYQQNQYSWLKPDPKLGQSDLSLFGYHTIDDWFGSKFSKLVSEFIINSAIVAKQKGYVVTKEEAWADLVKNAEMSFKEISEFDHIPVNSRSEYMNEQFRRMGLDSYKATKIWQKVLLFRKLFQDITLSQVIEPNLLEKVNEYNHETAEGFIYRLPEALRLREFRDLAYLQTYLDAVSADKTSLSIPKESKKIEELQKNHPELVQKRYLLFIKDVSKKNLESRVSVKETLAWQSDENNFNLLKKEFSELGVKDGSTLDDRMDAIFALDDNSRTKVDEFARSKIVDANPEWLDDAFEKNEGKIINLPISLAGAKIDLKGIDDRKDFMDFLNKGAKDETYTQDKKHFYRIEVLDTSDGWELLTYQEALTRGVLDSLLTKKLKTYFESHKDLAEGKPFEDVKWKIAEAYYADLLKKIEEKARVVLKDKAPKNMIADIAAQHRFLDYAYEARKNPEGSVLVVQTIEPEFQKLTKRAPFADQFKWIQEPLSTTRMSKEETSWDKNYFFTLKEKEVSEPIVPANGDVAFFQLTALKDGADYNSLYKEISAVKDLVGNEGERQLGENMIKTFKEKKALDLDFFFQDSEEIEPQTYPDGADV